MNRFLTGREGLEVEFPRRAYARVDQIEALSPSNSLLLFDSIDADDFDRLIDGRAYSWVTDPTIFLQARIYIVAVESADLGPSAPSTSDSEDDTLGWYYMELERDTGGPVLVYPSLFGDGVPSYLRRFEQVPKRQADRLDAAFDLGRFVIDGSEIENALRQVPAPELVAAYDVGQGAASALIERGVPHLYFDLGGGVQRHHRTFPEALKQFCFTAHPPVVLSHWDWDHWSSGARFEATNLIWIAPHQKLGAVHAAFAATVVDHGRLLIWPADVPEMFFAHRHARILRCTGNGRNNSGLALEAFGSSGESPILLPGDARYSSIPHVLENQYTSIVASHHGGDVKEKAAPSAAGKPHGRVVYSCAENNGYGHPSAAAKALLKQSGWPHACSAKSANVARYTFHRGTTGLGHVALGWGGHSAVGSRMACGDRSCDLAFMQD